MQIYIKSIDTIVHIPRKVILFYYDRYIKGSVEVCPSSDQWVENMSVDVAGYLRDKKGFNSEGTFQYCDKSGALIRDDKYSTGLYWSKDE